jgi:uncharacterized membrane protein
MESAPAAPLPARSGRLAWLDLFRGLAVFGMFDTHITNALLRTPAELTGISYLHDKLFNLPAPAFLFAAGISFGLSVAGRWNELRSWSPALRSRLARLAEILLLGLVLHVPFFSFRRTFFDATPTQFRAFLNMDVLECIAASLFVSLALVWLTASPRGFLYSSTALTGFVTLATPWIWKVSAGFPWWIGTYVGKHWDSFFPLFPYAAFVFAGAVWGSLYTSERKNDEARFLRASARCGLWFMATGAVSAFLPLPAPYSDFWNASPQFFLVRVGFFAVLLPLLVAAESKAPAAGRYLAAMGRESLVVYIAHLVILYGSLINPDLNLRSLVGKSIGFGEWFVIYALLTAAMVILARGWSLLKSELGWRLPWVEWAVAACLAAVFVIR